MNHDTPILSTPRRCRVDFLVPAAPCFRFSPMVFGVRSLSVSDGSIAPPLAAVFAASSASTVQSLTSSSSLSSSLYSTIRCFTDFFAFLIAICSLSAFLLNFVVSIGPGVLFAGSLGPGVLFAGSLGPGVLFRYLLGPGAHASFISVIWLYSAADLKETPLRLNNDPFSICTVWSVNFSIFNGKRLYLLGSFGSVFPVFW